MKVVIVKDYDAGNELARLRVSKLDNLFSDLTRVLSEKQRMEDILGLGYTCPVIDAGIRSFSRKGLIISNDAEITGGSDFCHTGNNSMVIGPGAGKSSQNREPGLVEVYQSNQRKVAPIRLTVTSYPEGYVLNTGKVSADIFGTRKEMFLASIGSRNAKFSQLGNAHIFPTLRQLLQYVKKHRKAFEYLVITHGYCFHVQPTCRLFAEDMESIPVKDKAVLPELDDLLEEINAAEASDLEEDASLSGQATTEEMKLEAIKRLRNLGVMKTVENGFRENSKVYMSEFGGILYDLNADAQKSILKMGRFADRLAYAVICSHFEYGDLYTVLYVGRDKETWQSERPDRDGYCRAYVYNVDEPYLSEFGTGQVQGANGGIIRLT